jgi:uncharacterized protein (TIRG00374 family)
LNNRLKTIVKFVVFLGVGLFIFYYLFKNFETAYLEDCTLKGIPEAECSLLDKIISDFKSVKVIWIIAILIAYMVSNLMRALRWNQMFEPMGYQPRVINTLGSLMIGYFTNLAFPRIGELIKTGTLSRYENIPFEKVIGTVVVDRILDIIGLLVVIGMALVLSFGTFKDYFAQNFVAPSQTTLVLLGVVVVGGLIGLFVLNRILQSGKFTNPLLLKIRNLWEGFKDGLTSLKKVKNIPLLIFYTVGIWVMYYLMTYLCFFAFAPTAHLGMVAGLVVFVFGTLGMVFPSPGGMGSYHLLISQALIIYGINGADAFSFSNIIFFAINVFGNILIGIFFFILLPIINRPRLVRQNHSA